MDVKVESVASLLKILTWQKIIQATVAIFIFGAAYGFWENRTVIYNSLKVGAKVETEESLILNLSQPTIVMLEETAARLRLTIGGIAVTNVNFKKNTRSTAYFAIVDPALKTAYSIFQSNKISDTVLFNDNEINNQRIINLINGEFICNDFKDTIAAKSMPMAIPAISTVCSISIPPYYGRFSGYMSIFLIKKPTVEELTLIRQVSRDISLRIYESDVDKASKYNYENQ